jgi:hypothetical protein
MRENQETSCDLLHTQAHSHLHNVRLSLLLLLARGRRRRAVGREVLGDREAHHVNVLARRGARLVKDEALLDLLAQLDAKRLRWILGKAVDARGDRALVGEVARDAALVLGRGAADKGRVKDEAVLGRVALGLEGAARPTREPEHQDKTR